MNSALVLYRSILKLHKGLPKNLRDLGDKYLRQEFKSHLYPKAENFKYTHYETFFKSWEKYLDDMKNPEVKMYGRQLSNEQLGAMTADQKKTLNSFKSTKL